MQESEAMSIVENKSPRGVVDVRYSGMDIGIFQRWSAKEHGPADIHETDPIKAKFLERKYILHSSILDKDSYEDIYHWDYFDINEWNQTRNNHPLVINNKFLQETKYNLKLGFVHKYIWENMCLCIDKTHLIITLQRKWREYINNR